MTDVDLFPMPVRERADAHCSLRIRPSWQVPDEDAYADRYIVYGVESYMTQRGIMVPSEPFPLTAKVNIEVGDITGLQVPWNPSEFVYGKANPVARWVVEEQFLAIGPDFYVDQWYPLQAYRNMPPLYSTGRVQHLRSYEAQQPMYAYKGAAGWIDSDALSFIQGATMDAQLPSWVASGVSVLVVGVFDKSAIEAYPVLTLTISGVDRLEVGIDSDDTIMARWADNEVVNIPNPYAPGRLVGLLLTVDGDFIAVSTITVDGDVRTATGRVAGFGKYNVGRMVVGSGPAGDIEVLEIGLWSITDYMAVREQVIELMAYYNYRRRGWV